MKNRGKHRRHHCITPVKQVKVVKMCIVADHRFCAYCGREITVFDYKNLDLVAETHCSALGDDGAEYFYCFRVEPCIERRKENRSD